MLKRHEVTRIKLIADNIAKETEAIQQSLTDDTIRALVKETIQNEVKDARGGNSNARTKSKQDKKKKQLRFQLPSSNNGATSLKNKIQEWEVKKVLWKWSIKPSQLVWTMTKITIPPSTSTRKTKQKTEQFKGAVKPATTAGHL